VVQLLAFLAFLSYGSGAGITPVATLMMLGAGGDGCRRVGLPRRADLGDRLFLERDADPAVESLAETLLFFGVAQQFLEGAQNISVGLLRGLGGHRGPVTPALPERSAPGGVDFVESFLISERLIAPVAVVGHRGNQYSDLADGTGREMHL
jgi:hypothetical protein